MIPRPASQRPPLLADPRQPGARSHPARHEPATIDHRGPEFGRLGLKVLAGIQQIFRTRHPVVIYLASGHGRVGAALVTLSPGDAVLMYETGPFRPAVEEARRAHRPRAGIPPRCPASMRATGLPWSWRKGVQADLIEQRLRADTGHAIKAVCVVHNETSTGVTSDASPRCAVPSTRRSAWRC